MNILAVAGTALTFIGTYGINVALLIIVSYGGYRLFTNHLKHIKDTIDRTYKQTKLNGTKINRLSAKLETRVALCEERHKTDK